MDGNVTLAKEKNKDGFKEVSNLVTSEAEIKEPKKSYVPEGFESVEAYLEDMRETYALDLQADEDNREAALEDKKFTAGEQWDPEVLQQRQDLPNLVVNSIPQFIAQLVGDWRTNRTAVKVIPSENGDKEVASIRSDLIRSIETSSRANRVYNDAFESMVMCGDGAFRVGVKYADEDVFDQDIYIGAIDDALSVVWDRLSIDSTGRDATRCFVDDRIPKKEFEAKWKDLDPSFLSDKERRALEAGGWCDDGTVRITEHWRMIERKRLLGMFNDGSVHALEGDDLDELLEKKGPPVRTRLAPCRYAQMHLVTGHAILAGPYEWKLNRLPIIRMGGRIVNLGERRMRYGLVRFMRDDARLRNFWLSILAEQLGYAPKAQWIATEEAVAGREREFNESHMTRKPLLIVNDEAVIGQNIQRVDPPPMQVALLNQLQVHTQNMKDISGIHDASLGIKSNETSGRAIMARQREGDIASLTYYDNGNAAVLEAGDVANQLIGQIYDGTRIIRRIGEDESTKLQKINDPMDPESPNLATGKYDVAVTTGASYTTRRVEAAEAMMEAIQVAPEIMQIAGDLVVKAQDWPGAEELSQRLRKMVPPHLLSEQEKAEMGEQGPDMNQIMQQQAQMQEQMQAGLQELEKLKVENLQLKLKAEIEAKKLEIDEFKAETERMKMIGEFAAKDEEFNLRQIEASAQMENNEAERELKRETAKKTSDSKAKPKSSE